MKQGHRHSGHEVAFTLVELSIVLILLGLMLGGLMALLTQDIRRVKIRELNTKLDAIEAALLDFRRINNRIPCPASGTVLITSSNFAIETDTTGDGLCSGANFTDGVHTAGGVVPVKTLGLPDGDMFDPWGGRLTYAVDIRATATNFFTTDDPTDTTIGSIVVYDGSGYPAVTSGAIRTSNAIAIIVSHGPDGHGAFQASGARKSSNSTNADELQNCHCDSNGNATTFDNKFVQRNASGSSSDILNNYDDITRYYLRSQLLSAPEAGLR